MALSEDSRTLLQLLLGRGKSYGDISGLLGIEESEVRDRAHQALTEINGSDPDKDLDLTDYLLGQSDPIARADVARKLADNPEAVSAASGLSASCDSWCLELTFPGLPEPRSLPRSVASLPDPDPRRTAVARRPAGPVRARPSLPRSGA